MSNDNDLKVLKFTLQDTELKANLGISRDETLAQFFNKVNAKKRDEFWGKILKHQKLSDEGFKLFVLDVANLQAELNCIDQALEHEPQYFMFLVQGASNQLCYVHQVEDKLDTAEQYLTNIRTVQQFLAVNAQPGSPQDQDKLRLTLIFKRFPGNRTGLELLTQLKAAGFELIVEFQKGSSPVAAQVLKSAFDHGITSGQGKALYPVTTNIKYLALPEAECPVLSDQKQKVPLHTFVVLDPDMIASKTRELKQLAKQALADYHKIPSAIGPIFVDEFGFVHQVFTAHKRANGSMKYQLDETKLAAVAYNNLSLILATTQANYSAFDLRFNLATPMIHAEMLLHDEELNTGNQGYHQLTRKQLYHEINRQSIINLIMSTSSLF